MDIYFPNGGSNNVREILEYICVYSWEIKQTYLLQFDLFKSLWIYRINEECKDFL